MFTRAALGVTETVDNGEGTCCTGDLDGLLVDRKTSTGECCAAVTDPQDSVEPGCGTKALGDGESVSMEQGRTLSRRTWTTLIVATLLVALTIGVLMGILPPS
ncbi:hypothetical protein EDD40_7270 [Saccharothrix texasensis]|uniref:Uncharacterized protein n=1 Tax=Saccharothrix texasensis TaxID=103734 RepID=A0A3N1HH22_9PSEU|nr:hypothetical protein EDD40_7270 [Saccharothrix texasensis]